MSGNACHGRYLPAAAVPLIIFGTAILLFLVSYLPLPIQHTAAVRGKGDTWTIVAVDPESGDVGVAGASCVPQAIDAVAALVPGKGAAAVQADFNLRNRNRVFALLQEDVPAGAIIGEVTAPATDPQVALRQYGIVTLVGGVEAASYTGADNFAWAGDRQAEEAAVAVQGNFLEGEAVVADTLAAYLAEPGPLPDRLLQALVAGSVAGGDRRCNQDGVRQTATAAFIMVARADQSPFAAPTLGASAVGEPDTPWLYLSVVEPIGGANSVAELQRQYALWREGELQTASQQATEVQPTLLLLLAGTLLLFAVVLVHFWRRRSR